MSKEIRSRASIDASKILNALRRERNLPSVITVNPQKITRSLIRQIAVEVWKKYPQSLTDPHYELGELTLALVNQEVAQRVADLRRGAEIKQAALKDYFN